MPDTVPCQAVAVARLLERAHSSWDGNNGGCGSDDGLRVTPDCEALPSAKRGWAPPLLLDRATPDSGPRKYEIMSETPIFFWLCATQLASAGCHTPAEHI